jgi:phosphoserine phosphatase
LTGKIDGEIVDRSAKARFLTEFAEQRKVGMSACVAIGDGANDLEMIEQAGLGISFRGKEILNKAADIAISSTLVEVIRLLK